MDFFLIIGGLLVLIVCLVVLGVCAFSVSNVLGVAYLAFVGLYVGAGMIQGAVN